MLQNRWSPSTQRQTGNSRHAAFPVLLIVIGSIWLFYSVDWLPDLRCLWILGLTGAGLAVLLLDGITKSSIVSGPLLMLSSLLFYLGEYHALELRIGIPVMLIAAGILQLIARSSAIPETRVRKPRAQRSRPEEEVVGGEADHD